MGGRRTWVGAGRVYVIEVQEHQRWRAKELPREFGLLADGACERAGISAAYLLVHRNFLYLGTAELFAADLGRGPCVADVPGLRPQQGGENMPTHGAEQNV